MRLRSRYAAIGSVAVLCAVFATGATADAASNTRTPPPPVLTGTPHSNCPAQYSGTQVVHVTASPKVVSNPGAVTMCDHIINDTSPAAVKAKTAMIQQANTEATRKKP